MVFNKDFDSALWLILKGDKRNRGKILDFIGSIPKEFYDQIHLALEKYCEYEANEVNILDREDICLTGDSLVIDSYKYSFMIDMMLHSLTVTKSRINNDNFNEIFELTMYAGTRINSVDNFGKQALGRLYDADNSIKFDYNLVDTMLGRMFSAEGVVLKKYRRISCKQLPIDVDIKNLSAKAGHSRVRKIH